MLWHFLTFSKEFCWPSRAKGIIDRDLKFAEYHYRYDFKILIGNIFSLILKNKIATMDVSLSFTKQCVKIFPLPPLEQKVL